VWHTPREPEGRHDCFDLGVGEGRVDVGSALLRRGTDLAGRGVLDRLQMQVLPQPLKAQVLHMRGDPWPRPRGRKDGHLVARLQDGRANQRRTRKHPRHSSDHHLLAPVTFTTGCIKLESPVWAGVPG
jgi:hypothetical protein